MAEVILAEGVKTYGEVVAVDRVSLTVNDGEFVALVGPSGCGKTTTLNLVAGLIELTDGNIYIGERLINDLDPKDRDIAMVFQNYALYPNKSVYANLEFPLKMRSVPKGDRDKRIRETAELLGIGPLLNRRPRELSGGQQQRVALGRALVRQPKAFLMDEPLSNLDAKLRVQMRAELKRFHQELGATVVYVTHDQMEAVTMADRIAVMNGGLLQQYDAPDEIYNRPVNTFVAGFIGSPSMNFIDAKVVKNTEGYLLDAGGFRVIAHALVDIGEGLGGFAPGGRELQGAAERRNLLLALTAEAVDLDATRPAETVAGHILGTPAYMAPEQFAGREVTIRSDLYSLGLVLYELFTGKRAIQQPGSTPSAPSTLVRDMDPAVERILLQCLEPEPDDRPSSALASVQFGP